MTANCETRAIDHKSKVAVPFHTANAYAMSLADTNALYLLANFPLRNVTSYDMTFDLHILLCLRRFTEFTAKEEWIYVECKIKFIQKQNIFLQ